MRIISAAEQLLEALAWIKAPRGSTSKAYGPSGRDIIEHAATPEAKRACYRGLVAERPNASASTRRKWARAAGIAALLLVAMLSIAAPAAALDTPAVPAAVSVPAKADPARVTMLAGPLASFGGNAPTDLQWFANILVDFPLATPELAPRVDFGIEFGALPGESLAQGDPTTWRTINVTAAVSQRFDRDLNFWLRCELGFTNRMPGDQLEPLESTARWWSCGILFDSKLGRLFLGGGLDQRLGGDYQPTAHASGRLRVKRWETGQLKKAAVYLQGRAILGLQVWYSDVERTDVVLLGLGGGF